MKKVLWIILIVFVVALGYFFFVYFQFFSKVSPSPTGKISEGIYCLKTDFVDSYLFTDGTNWIIIDAGYKTYKTLDALKEIGINGDSISAVFLTHSDYDHVGGLPAFPKAIVYMGAQEEVLILGKIPRMMGFVKNKPLNRDYKLIGDGETIKIGNINIKAVWTPGHTPGSMVYLINDNSLATGDTLMFVSGKLIPTPNPPTMDEETEKKSIKKLAEYSNVSFILTAHTGIVTNGGLLLRK